MVSKMLLGNPYNFAVYFEKIEEWNIDDVFCNGVLMFFLNGEIFPKKVIITPLNSERVNLKDCWKNIGTDTKLFSMPKLEAFRKIYDLTFPENTDIYNDYRFDITPLSFEEDSCHVFAVSNGDEVRILGAKLRYICEISRHDLKNCSVTETVIQYQEFCSIMSSFATK